MYVALYDSSAGFEGAGVPRRWGVARLRVDRLSAPLAGRDAAGLGGQRIRSRRCTGTAQLSRLCASRRALSGALYELGVRPGHVVAIQLPNWWQALVLFQAVARL